MNNTFRVFADRCQRNTTLHLTTMSRACVKLEKKDGLLNLLQSFQFLDIQYIYFLYRNGLNVGRNWEPRTIVDCILHDCIIKKCSY
jgi:hypothetical protein